MNRRQTVLALAVVPVAAYAAACMLLYHHQRRLIYNPKPRTNGDVPTEPMAMRGAQVLVSRCEVKGPRAVVYFGGNSEDVSGTVPLLAEAFPKHSIYALHYRGFGGSDGVPTEVDIVADGESLFDTVRKRHPDIILIGRSLGSGVAIQVAARRRPRRLILVTPYDSIADVAATHFPAFPARWIVQDRFESWRVAPRIYVRTTVITAEHDKTIPLSHTRRLLEHFQPGVAREVVLPGAGHSVRESPHYIPALRGWNGIAA